MSTADAESDRDVTQNETKRTGDGAGTSTPARDQNNVTYTAGSLNSSDSDRRTDLRTDDRHCSWREVAAACHVEPGR